MAKKIKDFLINDIFASAGFAANEIEFINAASDLSEVEISDELVKKFHDNMLSREAAKNNTELEKMFRSDHWAEFASIVDKRIEGDISRLEETQKTTVKEIKNTPDKIGKLLEFLRTNKPNKDDSFTPIASVVNWSRKNATPEFDKAASKGILFPLQQERFAKVKYLCKLPSPTIIGVPPNSIPA